MQPAADAMAQALAKVSVKPPVVPLVANVLARPISGARGNRALSGRAGHRYGPLAESILFMAQSGVTDFYEIGAGKVSTGLIKRIADAASASSIGTPDDIARFNAGRG